MIVLNFILSLLLFMNEQCQIMASEANQCDKVTLNEPRIALVGDSMSELHEVEMTKEGMLVGNMITKDPLVNFNFTGFMKLVR